MDGPKGEPEELEVDAMPDWEPVEILQDGGDVEGLGDDNGRVLALYTEGRLREGKKRRVDIVDIKR